MVYLEPSRLFVCEFPDGPDFSDGELRVSPPARTRFGSPLAALYDMSRAEEYFGRYLRPLGVRPCSKLHIIADIPAFIRAWRFESPKLAGNIVLELEENAPEILPQAPSDCLWYVFDMKMRQSPADGKTEKAVLLGLGEEICGRIWGMARAGGCEPASVCPLSLLSLARQVRVQDTENGFALFWSAASGTHIMAHVGKNDGILSVEDISEMRFGLSEELMRLCDGARGGSISITMLSDGVQERNIVSALPEILAKLPGLADGAITRDGVREIFREYAFALVKGGGQ